MKIEVEPLAESEIIVRPPRAETMSRYFKMAIRLALALLVVVFTLAVAAFLFPQQALTVDSGEVKADLIIVLGGGDGRAERGAELYRQGAAPRVLVTGYGDCESNIKTLERLGVPESAITPEPAALSTLENATRSIPLMRAMRLRTAIVTTSWYHSRRALACFQHVAPDLRFYSRPSYLDFQPKNLNREGYSWHVNYEYVKIAGYWIGYAVSPL
jgi:uncharacterized SAM-binding protein YcdF (DUF218 family)